MGEIIHRFSLILGVKVGWTASGDSTNYDAYSAHIINYNYAEGDTIMKCLLNRHPVVWPLATLLVGIVLGGFLPHIPLHAVATDRAETYLMATGLLDTDVEAVYFLDCLTGDLFAAVPG